MVLRQSPSRFMSPDHAVGQVILDIRDSEHVLAQEPVRAFAEIIAGDNKVRIQLESVAPPSVRVAEVSLIPILPAAPVTPAMK